MWRINRQLNPYIDIAKPIAEAIASKKPVVALETTIVTHGMPYPANERVALEVEEIVRQQVYAECCSFLHVYLRVVFF